MRKPDQQLSYLSRHLSNRSGDKLAKWCVMGVQGAIGARVMEPVYISQVVIGNDTDQAMSDALRLKSYLKVHPHNIFEFYVQARRRF